MIDPESHGVLSALQQGVAAGSPTVRPNGARSREP